MGQREEQETTQVRELGDRIGYGRMMQLAEQIWNGQVPGGAHSVGPCVALLVKCPHPDGGSAGECDWCCGSGRVTKRVLQAQNQTRALRALAIVPLQKRGVQNRVQYYGFRCRCCCASWLTEGPEIHSATGCPLEGTQP